MTLKMKDAFKFPDLNKTGEGRQIQFDIAAGKREQMIFKA
jgi:hypothetical protein